MDGIVKLEGEDYPYYDIGGEKRICACIPSDQKAMAALPKFGDSNPIISESDIIAWLKKQPNQFYDLGVVGSPILDQDGCGGCGGWSSAALFNLIWNLMSQTTEQFSPGFQYSQVNGGMDGGSTPTDNMNSLLNTGICLLSDNPHNNIFKRQISSAATTDAARFKLRIAYNISGWEDIISCIVQNRPAGIGSKLPRGYQNIDSTTGLAPSGGFGGLHAQLVRGLFLHPALNNELVLLIQNSWTKQFGIQGNIYNLGDLSGCCFMRQQTLLAGYFEAYAGVAAIPDPKDPQGGIPIAKDKA